RAALQNLISNAVKYGGEAKWLRIAVSGASDHHQPSPRQIAFSVADRGFGITADDRKHIFEPFYRGREALARRIQGSGLGLNLVQRIAEAHGGRVTVASEPGKGSTFTMVLPAASGSLSAATAAEGPESSGPAGQPLHGSSLPSS